MFLSRVELSLIVIALSGKARNDEGGERDQMRRLEFGVRLRLSDESKRSSLLHRLGYAVTVIMESFTHNHCSCD